ncbi:hypothetical protein JCM10207_006178 [Rhodosporidiobolus poonsookiae]
MAYFQPRPYVPGQLHSPESYDSLRPPYAAHTYSTSGQSSPASSSDGVDGAFAALQGQRGRPQQGGAGGQGQAPPPRPSKLEKPGTHPHGHGHGHGKVAKAKEQAHQVLELGGTGLREMREDPRLKRKRIILMIVCGSIVAVIVALAVLGCKGLL